MALTSEDLLSISQLLDVKFKTELEPIKADIKAIKEEQVIIKNEQKIIRDEQRYEKAVSQMAAMQSGIDITKKVLSNHSKKLKKISFIATT